MRTLRRSSWLALLFAVLVSGRASAWQIEDPIHKNCHERITRDAISAVRYVAPPPAPTTGDRRLSRTAEFGLDAYDGNPFMWGAIIGVRYPDLRGAPSFDFDDLARVHNAPDDQGDHCLRSEEQDGEAGNAA